MREPRNRESEHACPADGSAWYVLPPLAYPVLIVLTDPLGDAVQMGSVWINSVACVYAGARLIGGRASPRGLARVLLIVWNLSIPLFLGLMALGSWWIASSM